MAVASSRRVGRFPRLSFAARRPDFVHFFPLVFVVLGVIALGLIWRFVRYSFVSVRLAGVVVVPVVWLKWPASIGSGIYLFIHHQPAAGVLALVWPFVAGWAGAATVFPHTLASLSWPSPRRLVLYRQTRSCSCETVFNHAEFQVRSGEPPRRFSARCRAANALLPRRDSTLLASGGRWTLANNGCNCSMTEDPDRIRTNQRIEELRPDFEGKTDEELIHEQQRHSNQPNTPEYILATHCCIPSARQARKGHHNDSVLDETCCFGCIHWGDSDGDWGCDFGASMLSYALCHISADFLHCSALHICIPTPPSSTATQPASKGTNMPVVPTVTSRIAPTVLSISNAAGGHPSSAASASKP